MYEDWFKQCWKDLRSVAGTRYGVDFFRGCYHFLQITQDGDRFPHGRRSRANAGDGLGVKGLLAVREVQPYYIHASLHKPDQHFRLAAGRTDGADDLGA